MMKMPRFVTSVHGLATSAIEHLLLNFARVAMDVVGTADPPRDQTTKVAMNVEIITPSPVVVGENNFATLDHIIPRDSCPSTAPLLVDAAEIVLTSLESLFAARKYF